MQAAGFAGPNARSPLLIPLLHALLLNTCGCFGCPTGPLSRPSVQHRHQQHLAAKLACDVRVARSGLNSCTY